MAPGVIQNSETIINNSLDSITADNGAFMNQLLAGETTKTCPIDHFNFPENGEVEDQVKSEAPKEVKKPVRRVIRPKVLKNHESHDYLYDRLYDDTCPRVVSTIFNRFVFPILPVLGFVKAE